MSGPRIDIGIDETQRRKIAEGLSHLLADTFTLYLKTHNYHWNVTGPMFQTLHTMFETQYNELWTSTDDIAERIRSLGFYAPGTFSQFGSMTVIEETKGVPSAKEMIKHLMDGHEAAVRTARKYFPDAEDGNDEATLDLLTQRMQYHEKTAWMLRSLLQE